MSPREVRLNREGMVIRPVWWWHLLTAVFVVAALVLAGILLLIRHDAAGWWVLGLDLLAIVLAIISRYAPRRPR